MNTKCIKSALVAVCLVTALAGTSRADDTKTLWERNCAACHGKDGSGNTMMGRKTGCRDYTDAKVVASLDDARAFKSVKEGLTQDGKERMKPYGSKLSDDQIKSLVAYMHSFKK